VSLVHEGGKGTTCQAEALVPSKEADCQRTDGRWAISRMESIYVRLVKPVFDRLGAFALLLGLSPVLLACGVAVRLALGRGVILRQRRVGLLGREFDMFKFRTMMPDQRRINTPSAQPDRRVTHKSEDDPRHTPVGRFLRRWSLDELPQLWNVANGDMSLVGPRPELPFIVAAYEPWQHERHCAKPGMTGYWQVTARGDAPMHHRTDVDLVYVRDVSLFLDSQILWRTLAACVRRKGT
jgi:lipopolysaccharide/colanic/teichoic acid biosynthesis glycosyltransferase